MRIWKITPLPWHCARVRSISDGNLFKISIVSPAIPTHLYMSLLEWSHTVDLMALPFSSEIFSKFEKYLQGRGMRRWSRSRLNSITTRKRILEAEMKAYRGEGLWMCTQVWAVAVKELSSLSIFSEELIFANVVFISAMPKTKVDTRR